MSFKLSPFVHERQAFIIRQPNIRCRLPLIFSLGLWNGVVGKVLYGEADAGITNIDITYQRLTNNNVSTTCCFQTLYDDSCFIRYIEIIATLQCFPESPHVISLMTLFSFLE